MYFNDFGIRCPNITAIWLYITHGERRSNKGSVLVMTSNQLKGDLFPIVGFIMFLNFHID